MIDRSPSDLPRRLAHPRSSRASPTDKSVASDSTLGGGGLLLSSMVVDGVPPSTASCLYSMAVLESNEASEIVKPWSGESGQRTSIVNSSFLILPNCSSTSSVGAICQRTSVGL